MKFAIFFTILLLSQILSKRINNLEQKCASPAMDKITKLLKSQNEIKSKEVENVFCSIDRAEFLRNKTEHTGQNEAIYIGFGATLSKPNAHVFAMEKALQKFKRNEKIKILDIGSGSGIL